MGALKAMDERANHDRGVLAVGVRLKNPLKELANRPVFGHPVLRGVSGCCVDLAGGIWRTEGVASSSRQGTMQVCVNAETLDGCSGWPGFDKMLYCFSVGAPE
jgi:hypothetical protein